VEGAVVEGATVVVGAVGPGAVGTVVGVGGGGPVVGGEAPAGVVVVVDRVAVPTGSDPRVNLAGEVWKLSTPTRPTTVAPMTRKARLMRRLPGP